LIVSSSPSTWLASAAAATGRFGCASAVLSAMVDESSIVRVLRGEGEGGVSMHALGLEGEVRCRRGTHLGV